MTEKVATSVTKMTEPATPISKNVSTSLLAFFCYIITIPYPSFHGSLFLERANVTDFLDRYSRVYGNYRISMQEKIRYLLWYCRLLIGKYIKTMIRFARTDWAQIQKVLREEYKHLVIGQQITSQRFLEAFKDKSHSNNADVPQYCRQYSPISDDLVVKGKLNTYIRSK